jgi:hypothetical protein
MQAFDYVPLGLAHGAGSAMRRLGLERPEYADAA